MKVRKRPAIWIAEAGLIAIAILGMLWGYQEMAIGAMGAIAALAHKFVESEEKGNDVPKQ